MLKKNIISFFKSNDFKQLEAFILNPRYIYPKDEKSKRLMENGEFSWYNFFIRT
jgi:hypothetical protein